MLLGAHFDASVGLLILSRWSAVQLGEADASRSYRGRSDLNERILFVLLGFFRIM